MEATTPDGCLAYGEVDIGVHTLEITPNRVALCEGESLVLEAEGGQMPYSWSGPQGAINEEGSSIAINSAGLYSVTVTNVAGCTLSQSVTIDDCCDLSIYFDERKFRNGDVITFTPENVMFGIVFLEVWDILNLPNINYTWEINGKIYSGNRIALRLIDFYDPPLVPPFGSASDIILTSHDGICPQSITVSVNDLQIDVADYLPPDKVLVKIIDRTGNQRVSQAMDNMLNEVRNIYTGNGIDWLEFDYSSQDESLDRITDRRVFFEATGSFTGTGSTPAYRSSYIKFTQFYNTPLNRSGQTFYIAHELLHQFLNELGLLLFSTPDFFQPDNTNHIDQNNSHVIQFGLNLNTREGLLPMNPPVGSALYNSTRIYPVHQHYVERLFSYFYLMDTDLIRHLTPIDQSLIHYPDYQKWTVLKNRFGIIHSNVAVHNNPINENSSFDIEYFEVQNMFKF
ncbi:MAG: hypothetical protein CV087_24195 [Candidatus Brocadia sp. WS118]|nr:MAG: hypothetical protein CV087_24195 [Candidatus Brocadia sp. WS118]